MDLRISTGAINSTGEPYQHIRKKPKDKKLVEDLIDLQMLDEVMAEYSATPTRI